MSHHGWLRPVTLAFASVVLTAAVLGTAFFVWSQYEAGSRAYQQYQRQKDADQKKAADKLAFDCSIPEASRDLIAQCLSEGMASYEGQSDANMDLKAQQDMAFWALWMFIVSAIGLPVNIAGLTAIFISLRHTRESITNDRAIGEAQVRAYLHCVSARYERSKSQITAIIELSNTGNSPASNVHVEGDASVQEVLGTFSHFRVAAWASSRTTSADFPPVIASSKTSDSVTFFWENDFTEAVEKSEDIVHKRAVFEHGNTIWFDLVVSWTDVFGKRHELPVWLDAITGPHPHSPKKKMSRAGRLHVRMQDPRGGTAKPEET